MRAGIAPDTVKQLREIGLFLAVVLSPLVVTPFTVAPFSEPKLLILLVGTSFVALSRPQIDRTIAIAAGIFVSAVALATVFGVDPLWSLLGTEWRGVGLLALAASAVLLCVATGLDDDLRIKIPEWLFWTGVVVAGVSLAGRFLRIDLPFWMFGNSASTLGHRVFVGGFLAAAIVASTATRRTPRMYLGLAVIASGLAVTAARSGWLALGFGLLIVLWRRRSWRTAVALVLPVVVVLATWTIIDQHRPAAEGNLSAIPRFGELRVGGGLERIPGWKAYARAWAADPILGSGPQTTWKGFIEHARPAEKRAATRYFADPHNVVIETADTTGIIGLLASIGLALVVLRRALRAPPERAWALGAAGAIAVVHLVEPVNVVNTPLMFLLAGLAVGDAGAEAPRLLPKWVAVPLIAGLAVVSVDFVAAGAELFGKSHRSQTALRLAGRIAPWRMRAPLQLALMRASDYKNGDRSGRDEAGRLVDTAVRRHGWYPDVRNQAADIYLVLDETTRAAALVDRNLVLFPNDSVTLATKARVLLRQGRRREAIAFATRALEIEPDLSVAQEVQREAQASPTPSPP